MNSKDCTTPAVYKDFGKKVCYGLGRNYYKTFDGAEYVYEGEREGLVEGLVEGMVEGMVEGLVEGLTLGEDSKRGNILLMMMTTIRLIFKYFFI